MSEYIRMFDAAIKAFFACSGDEKAALPQMESIYRNYLKNAALLL